MVSLLVCSCLFVLFFVLPKATCIFNPTKHCGKNEFCFPFLKANSVEPSSTEYSIRCNNHSELEINLLDGSWRTVKETDCTLRRLIVLDQELGNILDPVYCNFLYIFDPPFHQFSPPHPNQFKNRTTCSLQDNEYFQSFLPEFFNLTPCRSYSGYYWNRWKKNLSEFSPGMCEVNTPHPALEFMLSFTDENTSLSLLSFGFSANLKLLQQCFNDNICKESSKTGLIIGLSTAGGFSFIMFCFLFFLIYRRWKRKQSSTSNFFDRSTSFAMSSRTDPELGSTLYTPIFSYDELYEATNAFDASKELGDGGFGTVYKGKLKDGRVVAVKRLYESNYRRAEQFMNEIKIVSLLRHQNLVTLYGCTSRHSRELLLVYEFIPNGTVADHLHGSRSSESFLPWKLRMNIAVETADALNYLHSVEPQIIHRDIKTNNILLDNNFHVKVGDFGLSRLFPLDATHVSTAPQGTPGYVDPEYHKFFQLTDKSDVYSFGVVLMELISSMPAVDINREFNEANLAYMAIKKIQRQELHEFVDPRLGFHSDSDVNAMITQVAGLALQCLQSEREMRPAIKEVLEVLRGIEIAGCKTEGGMEVDDAVKEEAGLLKSIPPYSPDSVADRWVSTSSSMSGFSG